MKYKQITLSLILQGLTARQISNVSKLSDIDPDLENLLKNQPVLDGHNDLPGVIRKCLSNQIFNGTYNFQTDLNQHPQTWYHGCASMVEDVDNQVQNYVATDYSRAVQGHLGAQLWSVYVGCETQYKDSLRTPPP